MTRFYNSIEKELEIERKDIPNGTYFRQCENCGITIDKTSWENIKYYSRYELILCDRCVDIKDGTYIKEHEDLIKFFEIHGREKLI